MDKTKDKTLAKWVFDNYPEQKGELKLISPDDENNGSDMVLDVRSGDKTLSVECYRDQWGTYITFKIGSEAITVAQEDGTRSFMDALVHALGQMQVITDIHTGWPSFECDEEWAKTQAEHRRLPPYNASKAPE